MPLSPDAFGSGTTSLSTTIERALLRVAEEERLTPALRARLFDIAKGLSYRDIAAENSISINTVKTEIRSLLRNLGVRCRHEIEHAVDTAEIRISEGATEDHIHLFLRLRWE